MSCISPVVFDRSDFDMEFEDVGNMITVDLNLGVIKNGDENIIDAIKAVRDIYNNGLRHCSKKIIKLVESKSSLPFTLLIINQISGKNLRQK
jgi:hypothetical protein